MSKLLHDTFSGSERISSGTYDPMTKEVVLEFPDGVRWRYKHVTLATWHDFTKAASAGRYLRQHLDRHTNGPA